MRMVLLRTWRPGRLVLAGLALPLLAPGCGDDGRASATDASITATTMPGTTSTSADEPTTGGSTTMMVSTTDGPTTGGCADPLVACGGGCVDTDLDPAHCGGCDAPCAAEEMCVGGACVTTCPPEQDLCGDTCHDLQTDPLHCGECEIACNQCETCAAGTCELLPAPAAPGPIGGPTDVCAGDSVDYTIPAIPGATGYTWTAPPGSLIGAGQGTTAISIQLGDQPGQVCVIAAGPCAMSMPACVDLTFGGGPGEQIFEFTGEAQQFVVPACITTLTLEAWGAEGAGSPQPNGGAPGLGGYAGGDLTVTPGDTLVVEVGGQDGYNGGGTPGEGGPNQSGNGGGASDVRTGAGTLDDRVLVGGGGGGASGDAQGSCEAGGVGGDGGHGGAPDGGSGTSGTGCGTTSTGGSGGTQNAGGANGVPGSNCTETAGPGTPGVPGEGGSGGDGIFCNGAGFRGAGGGGGGGGYFGGGGGSGGPGGGGGAWGGGGGGGGSSYIGGVLNGTTMNGIRSGNGQVRVSW